MRLKMYYVLSVLKSGFNLLLIDADIVLLRNPLNYIRNLNGFHEIDMFFSSDERSNKPETFDWICAGFFYVKSNRKTIEFFTIVLREMDKSGSVDQDVIQWLLTGKVRKNVFINSILGMEQKRNL